MAAHITPADISKHCSKDDIWIIIDGKVSYLFVYCGEQGITMHYKCMTFIVLRFRVIETVAEVAFVCHAPLITVKPQHDYEGPRRV